MAETQGLFKSTHEALTFAFNYAGQQSPRTPMARLMQGAALGSGRGLAGIEGAAQAGMVLAAVARLPKEQSQVITVRYGDVRYECPCCGQPAPQQDWLDAVDALSRCVELEGVPRKVRHAVIERAVCRRKWDAARLSIEYGLSERTLRHSCLQLKRRLGKLENTALAKLDERFAETGLVIAPGLSE